MGMVKQYTLFILLVYKTLHPTYVFTDVHTHLFTGGSLLHTVAHRLSKDLSTESLKAIEGGGKNILLPTSVDELHSMIDAAFHQPNRLKFHRRMSEAMLDEQLPKYDYFKESKAVLMMSLPL